MASEPISAEISSSVGDVSDTEEIQGDPSSEGIYCAVCQNKEGNGKEQSLTLFDFYHLLNVSAPLGALSHASFQKVNTPLCQVCCEDVWEIQRLVREIQKLEKSVSLVRKLLKDKILTCSSGDNEGGKYDSDLGRALDRIRINVQKDASSGAKASGGKPEKRKLPSKNDQQSNKSISATKEVTPKKSSFGRVVKRPRQYSDESDESGDDVEQKFDPEASAPHSHVKRETIQSRLMSQETISQPSDESEDDSAGDDFKHGGDETNSEIGEIVDVRHVERITADDHTPKSLQKDKDGSETDSAGEDHTDSDSCHDPRDEDEIIKPVYCDICQQMFSCQRKLRVHMKKRHVAARPPNLDCKSCHRKFDTIEKLNEHRAKEHPPKKAKIDSKTGRRLYQCDVCNSRFRNYADLQIHHRSHTNEKPFKCTIGDCKEAFVSRTRKEYHIEVKHTSEAPLKCPHCPRAYFRPHRLRGHLKIHSGDRPYLCEICSKAFTQPSYLRYHQTTHKELNLAEYRCEHCDRKFASPVNLRSHIQTQHQNKYRYHCDICGHGSWHLSHMKLHMRCHNGDKPYKCELCEKSYTRGSQLKIHMRSHTGERPFTCKLCSKGFTNSSKLRRHEATHLNKKNKPLEVKITPLADESQESPNEPSSSRSVSGSRLVAVGPNGTEILLPTDVVGVQVEEDANGQPVLKLEHIPGQEPEFSTEQQVITDGNGMAFRIIEIDDGLNSETFGELSFINGNFSLG